MDSAYPIPSTDYQRTLLLLRREGRGYWNLTADERRLITSEFLEAQPNPGDYVVDAAGELGGGMPAEVLRGNSILYLGTQLFNALIEGCRRPIQRDIERWGK